MSADFTGPDFTGADSSAEARLAAGYARGRQSLATHGATYALGTRLLPTHRRQAVYALYGFARMVDDIVDVDSNAEPPATTIAKVNSIERQLMSAREGDVHGVDGRLLALADTAHNFGIDPSYFTAFLYSMRMDIPSHSTYRTTYDTWDDLAEYMYGSAAVIGLQLLPILGTADDEVAAPYAAALGEAFQLTNFIRDIGEDLDRGRIYLPHRELRAFGVDEALLRDARKRGFTPAPVARLLASVIAVTRARYRDAEPGLALIDRRSRPGIRAAFELYRDILTEIEAADYQILHRRVRVHNGQRLWRAVQALALG